MRPPNRGGLWRHSSLTASDGLIGGGRSPAWSLRSAATSRSPAATLGSEVALAILSSAAEYEGGFDPLLRTACCLFPKRRNNDSVPASAKETALARRGSARAVLRRFRMGSHTQPDNSY
jgi:hypothetical protein